MLRASFAFVTVVALGLFFATQGARADDESDSQRTKQSDSYGRDREPESYQRWRVSAGVMTRFRLHKYDYDIDGQINAVYTYWFARGFQAPFLDIGTTLTFGSITYRDRTQPNGMGDAFRMSTGPILRFGYGTTYMTFAIKNRRSYYVCASVAPVLMGSEGTYANLPDPGAQFGVRSALMLASPGWIHPRDSQEDYAILLAILVPSSIEFSIEEVPLRTTTRLGFGLSWEL